MHKRVIGLALLTFAGGLCAMAKDSDPATRPAEPLIGQMRVATLAPIKFLYIDLETSFATLPQDVGPAIDRLVAPAAAAGVRFEGPLLFRYPPITDMSAKFTLQIGFAVKPETKAPPATKLVDLPAFKCATLLYTGPMAHLHDGFENAFKAISDAGLTPAGESREAYLYFETPESDNDVTQIQIAVQ